MINKGSDVVGYLESQHERVKGWFEKVLASSGEKRRHAFYELRRLLAIHETAEEEIVHPAARRALANGEQIVRERLREENEAKKVLAELETLDVDSPEFEQKLIAFQSSVIAHAEAEETQEFEPLRGEIDQKKLEEMKKTVQLAESIAPTRPHAGIEGQAANILVGPFASMIDRARDAIAKNKH